MARVAQGVEFRARHAAGTDTAVGTVGPVAVAAAADRQAQFARPLPQLPYSRRSEAGILDLDRSQSQVAQLGELGSRTVFRRVRPGRDPARLTYAADRLLDRQQLL